MKEIFTDGIANISLTHGLVICDFFHLVPDHEKPSRREAFFRVTLPLQGFLGLASIGEEVVHRLVKAGVYRVGTPEDSAPAKADRKPAKKAAPAKKPAAPAKPAAKPAPAKKSAPPAKAPAKGKKPAK